ncbi:MAG: bifunctional oligoribonuclease/PAP phosphatase NrnA [Nitrospirae bacterium]|nr:bifunctional oligoribonuclease/PAP phosphatase NrnA [Nitrospirota bacterium]
MNDIKDIASFIKGNDSFVLATHVNPEGDALGSAIALSMALSAIDKKTIVYDRDPVPEFYKFMPGWERVRNSLDGLNTSSMPLILLDCNDPERAGVENLTFKHTAVIDHHEVERGFGDIRWIEPSAPATGLMVYRLIKELGISITEDIAVNLYTAIAVDTGTFRYNNTTPEVLRIASSLVEAGALPSVVAEGLYETWSQERFRLLSKTLETLEIIDGIAITVITKDMFKDTGASSDDTENFVGYPRMMKDINVSALFRELAEGSGWKVSLRSKKDLVNVAVIAESFGGGGHRNAAGYKIKADLKTAKELLLKSLKTDLSS